MHTPIDPLDPPADGSYRAMVVTDLDGTLLDSRGVLSAANRRTLEHLGEQGVLRVIATGRNLYSARLAIGVDTPVDYLVFASGAGTIAWPDGELLNACHLDESAAWDAAMRLMALGLDFMLHAGVPHNHRFWYHRSAARGAAENPDFERRVARYRDYCEPLPESWSVAPPAQRPAGPFSQLLAVHPAASGAAHVLRHDSLRSHLAPLNVIRATSPLDHHSVWFEVFADGVSKATGAQWLLRRYGLDAGQVLAIGNDYNDEDLLGWAAEAAVVGNAPPTLRARYASVASNDADGFSDAVTGWLGRQGTAGQ